MPKLCCAGGYTNSEVKSKGLSIKDHISFHSFPLDNKPLLKKMVDENEVRLPKPFNTNKAQ